MSFVCISPCLGGHDIVLMSPNSGAALDAVLQEEAMSNEQWAVAHLRARRTGPGRKFTTGCVVCDGVRRRRCCCRNSNDWRTRRANNRKWHYYCVSSSLDGTTSDNWWKEGLSVGFELGCWNVVEKDKRKYRISPHPLKGTKQLFDNNVKNHYTEILKWTYQILIYRLISLNRNGILLCLIKFFKICASLFEILFLFLSFFVP